MRPLHSSYKNVDCATADAFVNSVVNWAKQNLSSANLRSGAYHKNGFSRNSSLYKNLIFDSYDRLNLVNNLFYM